jgi:chromosome transmission fidelity protein 4
MPLLLLAFLCSHAGTPGSTITQLAFSPRENLLAWTDTEGIFSRWLNPVPSTFPDPVKSSIATSAAAPVQAKLQTGLNLFADDFLSGRGDTSSGAGLGGVDLDADLDGDTGLKLGDMDDDWIIDDIGGGAVDDAVDGGGRERGGYVKEMGGYIVYFLG